MLTINTCYKIPQDLNLEMRKSSQTEYFYCHFKGRELELDIWASFTRNYHNKQLHVQTGSIFFTPLCDPEDNRFSFSENLCHSLEMMTTFSNDRVASRWYKCVIMFPGRHLLILRHVPLLVQNCLLNQVMEKQTYTRLENSSQDRQNHFSSLFSFLLHMC